MSDLSRRDFLKLARNGFLYLSGALALSGLLRFLDYDPNPAPQTEFDLGLASNYPLHSRTLLSNPPAVLLHTENGFAALSLVCTHLGCTVEKKDENFTCPCHGSRFNMDGKVSHGPADEPLPSLRVEVTDEGNLKLFTV
jgi:cytochrome b6-f complex iron-sulfur subunit